MLEAVVSVAAIALLGATVIVLRSVTTVQHARRQGGGPKLRIKIIPAGHLARERRECMHRHGGIG